MTTDLMPVGQASDARELALFKAIGLDKLAPEQRELALNIAGRYGLDLMLKHLVIIEGRPYITRDGLIHVAHRSGVFDGIEVTDPVKTDGYWRARCSVYRTDKTRPFTYPGRYPAAGGNQKYNEEMAIKVAEVAALRRAFDVSAPTVEERWEGEDAALPAAPAPGASLAEIAAAKAAALTAPGDEPPTAPANVPASPAPDAGGPGATVTTPTAQTATTTTVSTGTTANTLYLNAAEFQTRATLAGLTKEQIRDGGKAMFPDKKAADLTDVEWGSLLMELTT